ncbi:MAG: T9SS type A sorting domain-containing protein [Bacteroidota bacterium]
MKKILLSRLISIPLLFLSTLIIAQAPTVTWEKHFPLPGEYEAGNYTANDIKQSPVEPGYVLVGSRKMTWKGNGYNEVMVMRVDQEGGFIAMDNTFTGATIDEIYKDGVWVTDTIPWDQVAYDMAFSFAEDNRYLITGYRDTTLLSSDTPPGLFLMEVRGDGRVAFDTLYKNDNLDWIMGRCIYPDLEGGYIIAGSILEDGSSPEQIMLTRVKKNEQGAYEIVTYPGLFRVNPVGNFGYATWVRPYGKGYLVCGTAYRSNSKSDLFLQKVNEDMYTGGDDGWTVFYGDVENDEFADAILSGDTIYMAGSSLVPGSGRYQIYVVKAGADGSIIWDKTYGGSTTHFAKSLIRTGDGNLLVAGHASVGGYGQMKLLKIDAATGDSLWMQSYGTNFKSAGIRDAALTFDFNYVIAGRASYTTSQDPRVYVMKLDNPMTADLFLAKEGLDLAIVQGTPTKDVIDVSADKINLFGIVVKIDSLFHPSVGDLEITLEHGATTVTLVDRPTNSGENFIHTAFADQAEVSLNLRFAPYTGWFLPEEPLFPFLFHDPSGEWILTVTDHGSGGLKATSRILEEWSLNLLVESGTGTGVSPAESLVNFGVEQIRPNPSSLEAVITFRIPGHGPVKLTVYNQLGQVVGILADEELPAGIHEKRWYPGPLAPGTYYIHLESGGMVSVRKALLTR